MHYRAALQFQSQAFVRQRGTCLRVAEIRVDAHAFGRTMQPDSKRALAAQHAGVSERRDILGPETWPGAGRQQSLEQAGVDARARAVRGQRTLQR